MVLIFRTQYMKIKELGSREPRITRILSNSFHSHFAFASFFLFLNWMGKAKGRKGIPWKILVAAICVNLENGKAFQGDIR